MQINKLNIADLQNADFFILNQHPLPSNKPHDNHNYSVLVFTSELCPLGSSWQRRVGGYENCRWNLGRTELARHAALTDYIIMGPCGEPTSLVDYTPKNHPPVRPELVVLESFKLS